MTMALMERALETVEEGMLRIADTIETWDFSEFNDSTERVGFGVKVNTAIGTVDGITLKLTRYSGWGGSLTFEGEFYDAISRAPIHNGEIGKIKVSNDRDVVRGFEPAGDLPRNTELTNKFEALWASVMAKRQSQNDAAVGRLAKLIRNK